MPDGHCADPSLPLRLDQGRGSSKKGSFSLRVSPALHPPERPSPRRADMAGHGRGSEDAGTEEQIIYLLTVELKSVYFLKAAVNTVCILSKSCIFFGVFRFAKSTNFLL